MADVQPLRALRYDLVRTGGLDPVVAPPYDVIDAAQRAELAGRSPYNVVHVDLPEGEDPYATAAATLHRWRTEGAVVLDPAPALWGLEQAFTGPDGRSHRRRGVLARVRVTGYGPGEVRPHERTHPGPKEDRLRLTRATRTNLSPIFALHAGDAWGALEPDGDPWGEATDDEGTVSRLWRVEDPDRLAAVRAVLEPAELLIADGHHRYETARVYAEEVGGEGAHRYVLTCLVSLEDPGLEVYPTHRLVAVGTREKQEALAAALREHFEITEIEQDALRPPDGEGPLELGYIDAHFRRAFRLRLKDQAIADAALAGFPDVYRRLDTAVLEALLLKGPLGLTDDDIDHKNGLDYSRTDAEALNLVLSGRFDAAFFMRSSPVAQIRAIAETGVNMPPKSTFFYPKVPTGLLFNPLT